ncbi:MAG TPA: PLP-dependent aminotransferase family protein, partial [Xanthomonadales bacterium]|nr:PLP-dependent aminotransferase family protein [Xanthomonadales bacterium]
MHLDFDGSGPLHGQLTRALKDAICARRLAPGARLPATRELARDLRLSRNTVLAAYEQLGAEGFIEGRIGSGSYVAEITTRAPSPPPARARKPVLAPFARCALEQRANLPPGHRRKPVRYNLEYGLPLVTPALQSLWRRALGRAADDTALDYPPAEGLPALRGAIAGYLARRRGLVADPEDIIIVSGVQQGLDLCTRSLLQPGEVAAIEEPHYQGTRQALLAHGAKLAPVPVDRDGLEVDALPRGGARLVCVTPSHQFPSGALMTLPRRMALLDWAARHDAWVIEDDYDGEFRYDVRPVAALKSLDRGERVIYVGSFSKV